MTNFERTTRDDGTAASGPGRANEAAGGGRPRVDMARLVRGLHDRCARRVAAALAEACRAPVEVRVSDVRFVEYRQFVLDVEAPTCLAVLRIESFDVPLALDLTSPLLFAQLTGLLGGKPRDEDPPRRPLTDIEQRLAARVVRVWQLELRSAWRDVAPLDATFDRWEYQPQRAALAPPHEPFMVTRFQVTVGEVEGEMSLAIPRRAIDELPARAERFAAQADPLRRAESVDGRSAASADGPALEICLDEVAVSLADLRALRTGDVIATDHSVDSPLVLRVDGAARFAARPGIVQGRRAVRLEAELDAAQAAGSPESTDDGAGRSQR